MGIPLNEHGWPVVDLDGETGKANVFLIGDVQRGPLPLFPQSATPAGPRTRFWPAKISSVTMVINAGITSIRRSLPP
jgi:NADPH-dependent 2,4-dienoyl-CoA reductase/sulfur reductase-like enzyme